MDIVYGILDGIWTWAKRNPLQALLLALVILRAFGSTVQTGWHGVLYRFGRARRVLVPGFRWLIPGVERVAKVRSRAITLDLPPQRIAIADGLVYDVSASLVYRIRDPIAALVEIDDLTQGCETLVAVAIYEALGGRTRATMRDRSGLDEEFTRLCRARLARWGLDVDRAGFTNIAPTVETLRLTQLDLRARERATVAARMGAEGLSIAESLFLLGADRRLVSHSEARYRRLARPTGRVVETAPRTRARMTMEDRDEAQGEIGLLVSDDWADQLQGQGQVAKRGRAALPLLRERLRRTGDEAKRKLLLDAIRSVETKKAS